MERSKEPRRLIIDPGFQLYLALLNDLLDPLVEIITSLFGLYCNLYKVIFPKRSHMSMSFLFAVMVALDLGECIRAVGALTLAQALGRALPHQAQISRFSIFVTLLITVKSCRPHRAMHTDPRTHLSTPR